MLMVNNEAQRRYERVLVPVDMSETSAEAIRIGLSTGLLEQGGATLLHAFSPMAKTRLISSGASSAVITGYVESERHRAMEELTSFLVTNEFGTRRWSLRVGEGGPMQIITRAVEEKRPDMLVMGTHGRSGLLRALIGSVTEEVLRSLNVDVLVVPPASPKLGMAKEAVASEPKA
ncbi:nucleotide-binding universal stress UspA family protein [Bradyrhizobium ottawaense]